MHTHTHAHTVTAFSFPMTIWGSLWGRFTKSFHTCTYLLEEEKKFLELLVKISLCRPNTLFYAEDLVHCYYIKNQPCINAQQHMYILGIYFSVWYSVGTHLGKLPKLLLVKSRVKMMICSASHIKKYGEDLEKVKVNGLGRLKLEQRRNSEQ